MLFVDNDNITDPRLNLAIEEHLLRNVQVEALILFFYINEPSVVVGRNQNIYEEVDLDYIKTNGIHLVRRLSGGGAVYHDLGNLNFSFVSPNRQHLHDFVSFTGLEIRALAGLGILAELRQRSSIFVNGRKISGNAQYASRGRMFSHGTLLFDSDLDALLRALNPRQVEIESHAVQSIRNSVTNIRQMLPVGMDIQELKQALLAGIVGGPEIATYPLTPADWEQIRQISAERYQSWEWTYGRSPRFTLRKSGHFPAGRLNLRIEVKNGLIQELAIDCNFASPKSVAELENRLTGLRYDQGALASALAEIAIELHFGSLTPAEFLALLY